MTRTRNFRELSTAIDADPMRRVRVERIRRAMDDTQTIARLRDVDNDEKWYARHTMQPVAHPRLSTIERAEDEYLDTLAAYVADMGGRLEVVAVFPDEHILLTRPPVAIAEDEKMPPMESERTATYAAPTDD